ncbi:MAG TPA: hypothetical protein VLS51_00375, partial [Propionibacteriaceae bacterium]|nr:hypothetical protein [Propionibacteriaceae bacterium]
AQRTFELRTAVPVPPEAAVDFLSDLARHRGLHPYLAEGVVTGRGRSDNGEWTQWRVRERPRLGPFRYSISFGARLTRTSPTSFDAYVLAAPGCTIHSSTEASPGDEPGTALVRERSIVTAPRLLLSYMAHHAEIAHARTFRLLPDVLGEHR